MKKVIGDTKVGVFHTGTNNFPYIERLRCCVSAPYDGPIAVVSKESPSMVQIFHRNGIRLGKRHFGNREFILALQWIRQNTLLVITSKGISYFLSFQCADCMPPVRISKIDIFRAFITEDVVITQQDRAESFLYSTEDIFQSKVSHAKLSLDSTAEQVYSSKSSSMRILYIVSAYSVRCLSYPNMKTTLLQTITFESPVELLEVHSSKDRVCIFAGSSFYLYTKHLDRRVALISLNCGSASIKSAYFLTNNLLSAVFTLSSGPLCIFLVGFTESTNANVDCFHISMGRTERLVAVAHEVDGFRVHTSARSCLVQIIDPKVACFQEGNVSHHCVLLKNLWEGSSRNPHQILGSILFLLRVNHTRMKSRVDEAILECLEISKLACNADCQKQALLSALFGMRYSQKDWTSLVLEVRTLLITLKLLHDCALPTFLTKEQLTHMSITAAVNRCVEYGEYGTAWTLAETHGQPKNEIATRWAKYMVNDKALADDEVLKEILPKAKYLRRIDYEDILFLMKENKRDIAFKGLLRLISDNTMRRVILLRAEILSQNFLSALQMAEELSDVDAIGYILLKIDSLGKKPTVDSALPFSEEAFHDLQLLKKRGVEYSAQDVYRNLKSMAEKWDNFIIKIRKLPASEWNTFVDEVKCEIDLLSKVTLKISHRGKEYTNWISNSFHLLVKQCAMAKETGNLGFLGKTFHETIVMCHSYRLDNIVNDLSKYFHYTAESKFWLVLLYLCEIKDWHGADNLINGALALNKIHIGPGVTEVLWEYGRYASNM
ncbi:vacuolar ATP synthase catalytic subunit A [Perkinsela sp. CCAP 1560/4]|nr:vacuolar ATP synthase catalytic subunit A [Perkinsela sp. CCAP 1560/4]|eukprot:KNH09423.1 vacuolar ATP synthase catalytic subunit A [Perkinsela sp. CCAP 1560/4]